MKEEKYSSKHRSKKYSEGRRKCYYCTHGDMPIDYKDEERLRTFITKSGKILPRRITGTCAKHQRILTRAIKKARLMALLPFIKKY